MTSNSRMLLYPLQCITYFPYKLEILKQFQNPDPDTPEKKCTLKQLLVMNYMIKHTKVCGKGDVPVSHLFLQGVSYMLFQNY